MGVLPCSGHPDLHIHAPPPPPPPPILESNPPANLNLCSAYNWMRNPYVNVRQVNLLRSSVQLNVWFVGEVYHGREVLRGGVSLYKWTTNSPLALPPPFFTPSFTENLLNKSASQMDYCRAKKKILNEWEGILLYGDKLNLAKISELVSISCWFVQENLSSMDFENVKLTFSFDKD